MRYFCVVILLGLVVFFYSCEDNYTVINKRLISTLPKIAEYIGMLQIEEKNESYFERIKNLEEIISLLDDDLLFWNNNRENIIDQIISDLDELKNDKNMLILMMYFDEVYLSVKNYKNASEVYKFSKFKSGIIGFILNNKSQTESLLIDIGIDAAKINSYYFEIEEDLRIKLIKLNNWYQKNVIYE